ncbi:MAG: DUF192 domain-containing protein [Gammaproteobacteria bacterium]|nr:DUF192 domain-containing protein [Gammaproteobacteria bacterium]
MNAHCLRARLLGLCLSLCSVIGFCLQQTILHLPKQTAVALELANNEAARQRGLMFRAAINAKHGMLFTFEHPDYWSIWMKHMNFPIDIIWLNQDKQVLDWVDNAPPCPQEVINCPIYKPKYPAMHVIELKAGQRQLHQIHFKQTLKY